MDHPEEFRVGTKGSLRMRVKLGKQLGIQEEIRIPEVHVSKCAKVDVESNFSPGFSRQLEV